VFRFGASPPKLKSREGPSEYRLLATRPCLTYLRLTESPTNSLTLSNRTQDATSAIGTMNSYFTNTTGRWETRQTLYGPEGEFEEKSLQVMLKPLPQEADCNLVITSRKLSLSCRHLPSYSDYFAGLERYHRSSRAESRYIPFWYDQLRSHDLQRPGRR
jgi:hypothetical protein